jgi:hypothetical protein
LMRIWWRRLSSEIARLLLPLCVPRSGVLFSWCLLHCHSSSPSLLLRKLCRNGRQYFACSLTFLFALFDPVLAEMDYLILCLLLIRKKLYNFALQILNGVIALQNLVDSMACISMNLIYFLKSVYLNNSIASMNIIFIQISYKWIKGKLFFFSFFIQSNHK